MSEMGRVIDYYQARALIDERKKKESPNKGNMCFKTGPMSFSFVLSKEAKIAFPCLLALLIILSLFL